MNSNERIAFIILQLFNGEKLTISKLTTQFKKTTRTIQRDFSTIKQITESFNYKLQYNQQTKTYYLVSPQLLDENKVLILIKILLESRSLNTTEIQELINDLLNLSQINNSEYIQSIIKNELTFYSSLQHKENIIQKIGIFTQYITDQKLIKVDYRKNRGQLTKRTILPVSIFFSEYYFYVICYEEDKKRYINLRIDRILKYQQTTEILKIPHALRLEESELRKKQLFMYSGREITFTFRFWGIVEAALDKLPNAKVINKYPDTSVIIEATAQDTGVIMWLLSQGEYVQVLTPPSLVKQVSEKVKKMNDFYS